MKLVAQSRPPWSKQKIFFKRGGVGYEDKFYVAAFPTILAVGAISGLFGRAKRYNIWQLGRASH